MTGAALPDSDAGRLEDALDRLVAAGRLTAGQAREIRAEYAASPARRGEARPGVHSWRTVLPEVGGYVGGAFVLAAALVLVGPRWDTLSRTLQISVLIVPAVLLLAAALLISQTSPGGWTPQAGTVPAARRRAVAVLWIVATILGAAGAGVIAGPDAADRVASATAAIMMLGGYAFCRTALTQSALLLSCAFTVISWTVWSARELTGTENASVLIGVALAVLAAGWLVAAGTGLLAERAIGLVGGCAVAFAAAEILAVGGGSPVPTAAGYLLLLLLSAGGLFEYVRTRMIGLLVVGVAALATLVPQAILDYTNGAIGAGGALLLIGLSIIGASVMGFRLRGGRPAAGGPAPERGPSSAPPAGSR